MQDTDGMAEDMTFADYLGAETWLVCGGWKQLEGHSGIWLFVCVTHTVAAL